MIQVTDCHVSQDPAQTYRGINPHRTLMSLMEKLRELNPDLILATGDLSEDGSRRSYRLLREYLHLPGVPVLALPGNHDDPALLAEAFPGSPVDSIAVSEHGPWQVIRLNSYLPGKPQGLIANKALDDLEDLLSTQQPRPRIIAVHHHPVATGSPWIDKYSLLEPDRLLRLINQHADIRVVLWGHVHHAFQVQRKDTLMLGGPSSAINSLVGVERFSADPAGPSCRWLDLYHDGTVDTGITPGSNPNAVRG